ncbi:TetR/AcrR family transcriptional regulator [Treponema vincentii]|uniref:TetR/AcrR family transcriptional regulator n=1 Tax=Treponema TaxID=157 RepID=UPI001BAF2F69|nr:TetR/AcrR family transcriptional regulator [Treponema vincentii]QUY17764.1 TetR/AcrR family transcriptional regulator [Treponema vincentii]
MPKTSPEYMENRRNEIIDACKKLYETLDFKDITIKEISTATSFSRPSIYNYFKTKEEIFLAIFQTEYELWTDELNTIHQNLNLSAASLPKRIAHSLEKRGLLLKLLAMNMYDMEEHSSLECLICFKRAYKAAFDAVENLLKRFYPSFSAARRQEFLFSFFPFLFGIYPYAFATKKQIEAMNRCGFEYPKVTIYKLVYQCVTRLLGNC